MTTTRGCTGGTVGHCQRPTPPPCQSTHCSAPPPPAAVPSPQGEAGLQWLTEHALPALQSGPCAQQAYVSSYMACHASRTSVGSGTGAYCNTTSRQAGGQAGKGGSWWRWGLGQAYTVRDTDRDLFVFLGASAWGHGPRNASVRTRSCVCVCTHACCKAAVQGATTARGPGCTVLWHDSCSSMHAQLLKGPIHACMPIQRKAHVPMQGCGTWGTCTAHSDKPCMRRMYACMRACNHLDVQLVRLHVKVGGACGMEDNGDGIDESPVATGVGRAT